VTFVIEKGVTIPPRKDYESEGLVAALRKTEVGDSIFCPGFTGPRCSGTIGYMRKSDPAMRFATRKDKANNGYRIWRIA